MSGRGAAVTPLERELGILIRKAHEAPRHLVPADLEPLREQVGDGALDYALVLGSFHFINRIADLLHVDSEVLPERWRRFELLRRFSTRLGGVMMKRMMDLENRSYAKSYEEALAEIAPVFTALCGQPPGDALAPLRNRPKVIEALRLMLEERRDRSSLDHKVLARVHRVVEDSLAGSIDDLEGFHPRPSDPVEAFAFVGTRYAPRATESMISDLHRAGYDDLGILDLAIAIADANNWARLHRLIGLDPELGYARSLM